MNYFLRYILSSTYNHLLLFILLISSIATAQEKSYLEENYIKKQYFIEMRDGAELFTNVYIPKDSTKSYPIMLMRTPYTVAPYEKNIFPKYTASWEHLIKEGFIFAFQDVRGKFLSEGEFINMRPHIPDKKVNSQVDESSDTYDTIEWLINNIPNNNKKVGMWGISYPGFYASMGILSRHPALKAVSPQAPITDWFVGDDMHHNGALTLSMVFNFFSVFGQPRPDTTTQWPKRLDYASPDAYNFFLQLGPLKNINENYFHGSIPFWNEVIEHPDYDDYWKSKSTLQHFNNVDCAVLTVGGWYDAEDLYGPLNLYRSIESNNPGINNYLIMGPWTHGGWSRTSGTNYVDMQFDSNTGEYFQDKFELPFFNYYLKNKGQFNPGDVTVFNTGNNIWRSFDKFPPDDAEEMFLYLNTNNTLSKELPSSEVHFDEYISDPQNPVPYTAKFYDSRQMYNREFMAEDQRFASSRPDVLSYETDSLNNDLTIAGNIEAELFVSTSGTDSDWIVKLIDVYPDDANNPEPNTRNVEMGGYEMLVRAEIIRGRYRNSYEYPETFVSDQITKVKINLNDLCHTFKKGHKIMVQVQSSWFPLFDMNPQKFVNIYKANEDDYIRSVNRVFTNSKYPSHIKFRILD